jgi:hypothetical protein
MKVILFDGICNSVIFSQLPFFSCNYFNLKHFDETFQYWLGILILVLDTNDNHDMFKPLKELPENIRSSARDARLVIIDQAQDDGNIFQFMICLSRYFSYTANDLGLKSEKMQKYEQAFFRIRQRLSIFNYLSFELEQRHKVFLKTILILLFKYCQLNHLGSCYMCDYRERVTDKDESTFNFWYIYHYYSGIFRRWAHFNQLLFLHY